MSHGVGLHDPNHDLCILRDILFLVLKVAACEASIAASIAIGWVERLVEKSQNLDPSTIDLVLTVAKNFVAGSLLTSLCIARSVFVHVNELNRLDIVAIRKV